MPRYYQDSGIYNNVCAIVCDFKDPGSYTWTVPTGVTRATFEIWGAGGGGAGKCCCNCYHGGPNGAGGGYARKTISVTGGTSYSVCVGYGGNVANVGSCTLHWCCYGQQGTTTYVTGTNLSNFCATGGDGGRNDCFYYCGCAICPGCGFGGDICAPGSPGMIGGYSDAYFWRVAVAGASPMGGQQIFQTGDQCCPCMLGQPGIFPGGGGTGPQPNICCCCHQGATGANGMVRIYY